MSITLEQYHIDIQRKAQLFIVLKSNIDSMVCQLSLFHIFLYVFINQNPVWINPSFDLLLHLLFWEVMHPSRLVIFNLRLQTFSWFLNTLYILFPSSSHFCIFLDDFQTSPHSLTNFPPAPTSFFIHNRLPFLLNRKIKSLQMRNPSIYSYEIS